MLANSVHFVGCGRGLSIISEEDLCVGYQILLDAPRDKLGLADWFASFAAHFGRNLLSAKSNTVENRPLQKHQKSGHQGDKHEKNAKESDFSNIPSSEMLLIRFEKVLLELQQIGFIKRIGDTAKCLVFNE